MARAVQRDHLIDGDAIANLGWRQGSILGPKLAKLAREHAPRTALADRADLLVVSSHDCDIVNFSLAKELWSKSSEQGLSTPGVSTGNSNREETRVRSRS